MIKISNEGIKSLARRCGFMSSEGPYRATGGFGNFQKLLDEVEGIVIGWQEIASAPRDGTRILVSVRYSEMPCIAYWRGSEWVADQTHYFDDDRHDHISRLDGDFVTHWMPLPTRPGVGG